mgnify:CR=1 FL=1
MHQLIDKKNKIIIYLILLIMFSTPMDKFIKNQNNYSSKIIEINVKGLSNNDNLRIYNDLDNLFYKNILFISRKEIQKIVSKYNIIEEYSIKKIYPSTINVNIKPTVFVARLPGNDHLVGANGKLIKGEQNNEILPYIFGEFNSQRFLSFKNNIEQSEFTFTKFKTLYFYPSNRWDILTNDNILIKLPQNNLLKSLNLAFKIVSNNDFKSKNIIDLRINNHLIIK